MGVDANLPPGLFERIGQLVEQKLGQLLRSGMLRSASIGEGGLTIRGGFLRLRNAADTGDQFLIGAVDPPQPDGTPQPGWMVRRADGTLVLLLRDAFPVNGPGGVDQALTWLDRSGNTVLSDDTDSGQGLARPYVGGMFGRSRYADMTVSTASATFETLWETRITKQQPRLFVHYRATMDTAATTGETRVLVDGVELDTVETEGFSIAHRYALGPVAGAHMSDLIVEIQGRRTSATGQLRVEAYGWEGRQT